MILLKKRTIVTPVLFIITVLIFSGCATTQSVDGVSGFEEGTEPWIVLGGEDSLDVTICWLSAARTETRLLFGEAEEKPDLLETEGGLSTFHSVTIPDLEPGEEYAYMPLFDKASAGGELHYTFDAPPAEGESFRVVIVGDMQPNSELTTRGGRLVAAGIDAEDPDLVVQLGDLVSIGGLPGHWKVMLDNISDFSPDAPLQAVAGNHDQYGGGGRLFSKIFPYDFINRRGLYYSFDYGPIHFVMANAFEKLGKDLSNNQKTWVEQDILDAREEGAEWIFLVIHNTVLSTGTMGTTESLAAWLIPLSDRLDVDGVFFGHDHHYEYWLVEYGKDELVFNPNDVPAGNIVPYWCAGGGGGRLEIDYGLLTMEEESCTRTMYSTDTGEPVDVPVTVGPWNDELYLDHRDNPDYGQLFDGKHYYQTPASGLYRSDAEYFGYHYGEQTLHYLRMDVEDGRIVISARYPNGDVITGPEGEYPQEFILVKE